MKVTITKQRQTLEWVVQQEHMGVKVPCPKTLNHVVHLKKKTHLANKVLNADSVVILNADSVVISQMFNTSFVNSNQ